MGIGGSMVEFSPATREIRVRFPANASFMQNHIVFVTLLYSVNGYHIFYAIFCEGKESIQNVAI